MLPHHVVNETPRDSHETSHVQDDLEQFRGFRVSAVSEIVAAFVGAEFGDELSDPVPEGVAGPFGVFAESGFQLREESFDVVQVRAVRRQVD